MRKIAPALVWPALFALAALGGAAFCDQILPQMNALFRMGMAIGSKMGGSFGTDLLVALFIFGKNLSVAVLCTAAGRPTRGAVPAVVCVANGVALGVLAGLLKQDIGLPYWRFALMLTPHGVIELPAIFWACTAGMGSVDLKTRIVNGLRAPAALLAAAAVVETWVSPVVGRMVVG
ncbi:hypothetical protein MTAT_16620 [Moorella thermoacetica]|uniref:Stage II sporulation protein M n=1 Tax=Neomoorella thermoacetica TaxID=1525 RepID=A0AAC9MU17_NEOTH|nr:stage II sporulation protein M [Moorella thermoacetica]AOQ23132.1 hypothetical protein Maut_00669 [Moorella thermoacetica]TYL12839.1 hypothetical protein MTAT_16620 [Moorella thermoacetica]